MQPLQTVRRGRKIRENGSRGNPKKPNEMKDERFFCCCLKTRLHVRLTNAFTTLHYIFEDLTLHQGFGLNLGKRSKMNIFGSLSATFEVSCIFGQYQKSNFQIKLSLSKFVIHLVQTSKAFCQRIAMPKTHVATGL